MVQTLHNFRLMCPVATFFRDGKVCEDCLEKSLFESVKHGCYRDSRLQTMAVARMISKHRRMKTYAEKVDAYIALTEFHKRKFTEAGIPPSKIFIKPNFVAASEISAKSNNAGHALFLGRLSQEKGVEVLLRAWRRIKKTPLKIAGEGPDKEALEALVKKLGLKNVAFTGFLDREACAAAMREARFLVLPSIWYEGMPMVLLEAFAMGKPAVASRIGGLGSIVRDGVNGRLFEPGNAEQLGQAVQEFEDEPILLEKMGAAAREEFESKYAPEVNYKTLMSIYDSVLSAKTERYLNEVETS